MKTYLQYSAVIILAVLTAFLIQEDNTRITDAEMIFSSGDEPGPDLRPYEWAYIKKTFPYYNADPRVYIDALEQAHKIHNETRYKRLHKGLNSVLWEFAGPVNVGGRVVDIEFDPNNSNIVYAGFATGGVFKSFDSGQTWFPIFDSLAVLTVGDIAIDPLNSNIIYVGTGEANGGHNNFPGGGVFKSSDAGDTWQFLGLEGTTSIGRIVIHPTNTNTLYLASVGSYFAPNPERGIYKSTDGGLNWTHSLFVSDTTGAIDIIMNPLNPDRMMAATWERVRRPTTSRLFGPSSGIYRTTDAGDNWTKISSPNLPDPNSQNVGRIGLAIHDNNPNIVYALYTDGYDIISLYRSNDFGNSWTDVDTDNELQSGTGGFSWYFGQVRVHPENPNIVYVLDVAFMRSTDGGNNWPIIYGYGGPSVLHVDHHALAFSPADPNFIICGNDGGINTSINAGETWSAPKNIPATQYYEIGLDYNNPQRLYGGTQDNGTNRTLTGNIDDWQRIFGGDGFYVIVDYTNPDIIYCESQFGNLGKSTNGGISFNSAMNGINGNEPTNWSTPVIMDPNSPNILYYGTHSIYRTTNGAGNWTKISPQLTDWFSGSRLGTITTIAVAPTNSNVIYAGTDDAHVWVTSDNGLNWIDVSAGLPQRWVTRVIVDPMDENIVYATFSGLKWRDPQPHVYRSTNKGNNWTDISSNLPDIPVNSFAVDNNYSNVLYLGSDAGMFVSFNTGDSWEALGEGLPILPIGDIKIHPVENTLVAGTYGRSMYKLDLNQVTSVNNDYSETVSDFYLKQNYPNPFNPNTKIVYQLSVTGNVTLKVYDVVGNEITTLVDAPMGAGNYEINFNAAAFASGVYFYKLQIDNQTQTKKMILLR